MCHAVIYQIRDRRVRSFFTNSQAKLPILKKDGSLALVTWGRRPEQPGQLPLGGWACLSSIEANQWENYFPKAVKLPILGFMEKTIEGKSRWFKLVKGQYLQGLVAQHDNEVRVYVVTLKLEDTNALYTRWPRIILAND
jgi:hypothetical protein